MPQGGNRLVGDIPVEEGDTPVVVGDTPVAVVDIPAEVGDIPVEDTLAVVDNSCRDRMVVVLNNRKICIVKIIASYHSYS